MRTVSWFSCGAASAVATKLALAKGPVTIAYCEVIEEHPDNKRFLNDCEKWFGQEIIVLGNDKYDRSIYKVFEKTRYLKGPSGARCTGELKKSVRKEFERPDDLQVFGYTVEEQHRVDRFIDANNDVDIWPILIEKGLTKNDCLAMLENAGIELPVMYKLGYHNNNCIGCVKGEAGYWNKIRVDFPEVFERMAKTEELLGRTVTKIYRDGELIRPTLRELPPDAGDYPNEMDIECGIFCHMAESEYAAQKHQTELWASGGMGDSEMTEDKYIEYEAARNEAMDKYFDARPQIFRTRDKESIFEAGFRMGRESLAESECKTT